VKPATRHYYEEVVARAVSEIRAALDQALDLTELSRRAALAPLHFHRIFRGLLGETPSALHRRLRLERAANELAVRDAAVTQIAFAAGYETHESFTRAFREAFGVSPTAFRESAQDPPTSWTIASRISLPSSSGIHFMSAVDQPLHLRGGKNPASVTVEELPAKRVLAVAHRGPYSAISEAFAVLDRLATPLLSLPGLEMVAIHHDDPEATPASELRADAGLVVPFEAPAPDGLHEVIIPAGRYAKLIHTGTYETLGDAWSQLMGSWLGDSPYRIGNGPSYEQYLDMHDVKTALYLPVERERA
jgi:AraC family transcriptional regulator